MIGIFCASLLLGQRAVETAPPGQLTVIGKDGKPGILVPLKKTSVTADIAGISARVKVVQTFHNPSRQAIEAIYTFPMPADAAVDQMRMNVAGRVVEGSIKRREEARRIYDSAKANGQVASLLDQERPNVFTQTVANIVPGATVEVEISYVQALKFDSGAYEFSFPMVVGPRYIPQGVPDADKIDPAVLPKEMRTGTNVSLSVHVDAGAPLDTVSSTLHKIDTRREGANQAFINLKNSDEIPNKDFILRYTLKGAGIKEQFVTHDEGNGNGSFCLVLNPPNVVKTEQVRPREVVFVMDQSGSQSGFPLEKSKELTLALVQTLRPFDTFNVIAFSNGAKKLWPEPRQNTGDNVAEATKFVSDLQANGGTEFLPAIDMALSSTPRDGRMKLVVFNTDGYVGNEYEILDRIQKYRQNSRMFTFGIGNSVNQFLIDAMSVEGRGGSETVTLADNTEGAKKRFIAHTHSPILTDMTLEFDGVKVSESTPAHYPDLYAGQPVVVVGRYSGTGKAKVTIRGKVGSSPWSREIDLDFKPGGAGNSGVSTLWAKRKIQDLTREDWLGQIANRQKPSTSEQAITDIALRYGIMSPYTSFVAVEKRVVNIGGKQRSVKVPVDMPDGVSFGQDKAELRTGSGMARGGGGGAPGSPTGGMGGAAAFGTTISPATKTKVGQATTLGKVAHEKSDNTFIVNGTDEDVNTLIKSGKVKWTVKVDDELLKVKSGTIEIRVWLKDASTTIIAALKKAGMTVEETDKGLKVSFGTISVTKLEALAKIKEVIRIEPLDP